MTPDAHQHCRQLNLTKMKKIYLFVLLFAVASFSVFSQIVVNQDDMPVAGDTLRVSVTNVVPAGYKKTAMDTVWNFAALEALSQRVDTFVTASSTPAGYQFVFVLLGGANLASPRNSAPFPGLPLTNGFTFFKNSATSYSDLGSAYTVQGIPLPAKYDVPDKLFQFPMSPGLTWSSASSFALSLPGLAYYGTQRFRENIVDGWGNLITPFGEFQTLRVKSTLVMNDSIYIDSLGTGFPFIRNVVEYKWLAKGQGIPVLQVNEEGSLVTATYRDIYRMSADPLTVSLGPDTAVLKGTVLDLHASVTGGTPPYQVMWNTLDTGTTLTVTVEDLQTYSVLVVDALQNFGFAQKVVSVIYPPGFAENASSGITLFPNPASGPVTFRLPGGAPVAGLRVVDAQGQVVLNTELSRNDGVFTADFTGLPEGLYIVRITTPGNLYTAKLQISRPD
jgi:hypothetical protein